MEYSVVICFQFDWCIGNTSYNRTKLIISQFIAFNSDGREDFKYRTQRIQEEGKLEYLTLCLISVKPFFVLFVNSVLSSYEVTETLFTAWTGPYGVDLLFRC